jgi:ADP-ribosylglycohydrolase
MLGAIIGDIVGSPYEFDFNNIKTTDFPLFNEKSKFTDDTVITVAVCEGLLDSLGGNDDDVRRSIVCSMRKYGSMYPNAGYGGNFGAWLNSDEAKPYNSFGNGSAMRVSAVSWIFNTLEDVLHYAKLTAEVTHNHPEGIKGAQATAATTFLARIGKSKSEIKEYIQDNFGYDLDRTLDEIRLNYHHVESCQETVPEAIIAFLESDDFEDAIRKAVSLGGDSDTLTAITGSIAETFYGDIDIEITQKATGLLDETLKDSYNNFCNFLLERSISFATLKHKGQKRIGGDDYISHPISVSKKLNDMGYSINYQLAALFHDLLEDTDATYDEIKIYSSHSVANAVLLLTKKSGYDMKEYISNIKNNKIALAVKLADRLHNLKCAVVADDKFKKKYIKETIDYYIPLSRNSDFELKMRQAIEDLSTTFENLYLEPLYKYIDYFAYKYENKFASDNAIQQLNDLSDDCFENFIIVCCVLGVLEKHYRVSLAEFSIDQVNQLKTEIDTADMEHLIELLSFYIRGERFRYGLWESGLNEGVFLSILNRLKEISETKVD